VIEAQVIAHPRSVKTPRCIVKEIAIRSRWSKRSADRTPDTVQDLPSGQTSQMLDDGVG
jgi:hypothetical protein